MILIALVMAVIGATTGAMIWHNRRVTFEEHERAMSSMGVVLAEQTSRYAQVIDLLLKEVQSHITNLNIATPADFRRQGETAEFHHYLTARLTNVPQLEAIDLIDTNGLLVNWSQPWPLASAPGIDHDYLQYFQQNDDSNVFISSVSKNPSNGKLSLYLVHRVNAPDGRFIGLVLGVVDVEYLIDFYQSAAEHVKQSVSLLRRDGTILLRYPEPGNTVGIRLPATSPWYQRVAEGGGSYITGSNRHPGLFLVSVHPLADYPLVVDIIMSKTDIFAHWQREAVFIASFGLAAALAVAALFWTLGRQFRRQADQNTRLEQGRQQFNAVLSNITQGICFFDADKRLVLWNRRYAEIYNLPPQATRVGRTLEEIMHYRALAGTSPEMVQPNFLEWHEATVASKQPSSMVVTLQTKQVIAIDHRPMQGGGWVATHEDITERQQAEANVVFMAHHDALTRLPNRVLFRERMEQAIAMAGRGTKFAVICLDLDKFKQINDTLGHPVGDGLLVAVAERLKACVREEDTVARLGGDEFAIIQLALRQPTEAEVLTNRIITAFAQSFNIHGHHIMAETSIGVTVAPNDSCTYETLMRDADIALYLSKTEGGGTARFFEPEMDARIQLRRELERDLQGAIARNEFELYYQPLISLAANKVVGFEALLRWHHPVRGLVSPLEFIPVAEETGMIVPIGGWALQEACLETENWPPDISVAVNLSPIQFKKGDLVGTVHAALTASGLRPDRLELEITESVLLRDTAGTLAALHRLREMGICVALDDFGTGYSSLSYLRSFPFNKIKIDQSFVRDLTTNKESMSIIRAVTGLGQSLGIRTTAEGVETLEQLNCLREEGCNEVQGYFFSRPVKANEIPALISRLQRISDYATYVKH